MPIAPFTVRPQDPDAWIGGVRRAPTWHRSRGRLDRAGFHALVRAAQLPLAELRHMGAQLEKGGILDRSGTWVEESEAIALLGRIAWDAEHGDNLGAAWHGHETERLAAEILGRRVIEEHFTA